MLLFYFNLFMFFKCVCFSIECAKLDAEPQFSYMVWTLYAATSSLLYVSVVPCILGNITNMLKWQFKMSVRTFWKWVKVNNLYETVVTKETGNISLEWANILSFPPLSCRSLWKCIHLNVITLVLCICTSLIVLCLKCSIDNQWKSSSQMEKYIFVSWYRVSIKVSDNLQ